MEFGNVPHDHSPFNLLIIKNQLILQDSDALRTNTNKEAVKDANDDARSNSDCARFLLHEDTQHWEEAHRWHSDLNNQLDHKKGGGAFLS